MKDAWRPYLELRAPRYTSYPSAVQFDTSVTAEDYAARLAAVAPYEPISLYVHVPYCRKLCWYCGCNMRVENNYERISRYVQFVIDEVRMVGERLGGRGRPVAIHFGGGTPNTLAIDDLAEILRTVECELGLTDDARLAIELDPRLIGDDEVFRLVRLGFTRISLGVQDFDPEVQTTINRVQSFDLVEGCVSELRAAGVDDVSFDVLYGLPKQTEKSFSDTMCKVVALAPDRVSVFGYAHLPQALPRQRIFDERDLPDAALRAQLSEIADEALIAAGYRRIGFDHYAKPDNPLFAAARENRLKRNFQGFTDDPADAMLGFGASAIGFIGGLYVQNEKSVRDYQEKLSQGLLPVARGVARTAREDVFARAINELLCRMETDTTGVFAHASPDEANRICAALDEFEQHGLIRRREARIEIVEEARPFARVVAAALDPYARPTAPLSRAI